MLLQHRQSRPLFSMRLANRCEGCRYAQASVYGDVEDLVHFAHLWIVCRTHLVRQLSGTNVKRFLPGNLLKTRALCAFAQLQALPPDFSHSVTHINSSSRDRVASKLNRKPRTKRGARKRNMTDAETIPIIHAPKRQGSHLD